MTDRAPPLRWSAGASLPAAEEVCCVGRAASPELRAWRRSSVWFCTKWLPELHLQAGLSRLSV